jgi:hypothetical protein
MRPGQWELRISVIKRSRLPGSCCMTLRTDMIEIVAGVIGIGSSVVITGMT